VDSDVVSVNQGSGDVSVVFTLGQNVYAVSTYPVGESPDKLVVGDLTGDGLPELIVASSVDTRVVVLKNVGGETFTREDDLLIGDGSAVGLRIEDFNLDGNLDIAVARLAASSSAGTETIEILSGDGTGTLEHSATVALPFEPGLLLSGELDGNPGSDLAVLARRGEGLVVFGNRGDGTFATGTRSEARLQYFGACCSLVKDLDADGDLDIVLPTGVRIGVAPFLNRGDGSFERVQDYEPERIFSGLLSMDTNDDGFPDLLAVESGHRIPCEEGPLWSGINLGDGTFYEPVPLRTNLESLPDGDVLVAVGDFDLTGDLDLALASQESGELVLLSKGVVGLSEDCNDNGTPDECELGPRDCDLNRIPDDCDITAGSSGDCDNNGVPDSCEEDCNQNSVPDPCEMLDGSTPDCNHNGIPDGCEPPTADRDGNGVPDDCDLADGAASDCNGNGWHDALDVEPTLHFAAAQPLAANSLSLIPADMDGDGDLDVVNVGSGQLGVLLNRGDGVFQDGARLPLGDSPVVVVLDLDGDRDSDLVLESRWSVCPGGGPGWPTVTMELNLGNGTLAHAEHHVPIPFSFVAFDAADFDGDGDQDLAGVVADGKDELLIYENVGGSFVPSQRIPFTLPPTALLATDIDGDADVDLVVATVNLSVFLNDGNGAFAFQATIFIRDRVIALTETDVNEDGLSDLLLAIDSERAFLLLNRGAGGFRKAALSAEPSRLQDSCPATVDDLDRDGHADIVFCEPELGLSVLLGKGDGTFQDVFRVLLPRVPESLITADIDQDGDPDLLCTTQSHSIVVRNNGRGRFELPTRNFTSPGRRAVAVVDMDDDGHLDVVAAGVGGVDLLVNLGDGRLVARRAALLGSDPSHMATGDLDGDGDIDLATASEFGNVAVLLNRGDGTLAAARNYAVARWPTSFLADDLDGDGDLDLALTNAASDSVTLLRNTGDGRFEPGVELARRAAPDSIVSGDWDGDGDRDVAVVESEDHRVVILVNAGGGLFSSAVTVSSEPSPRSLIRADLDADGDDDLVVTSLERVALYWNRGGGEFEESLVKSRFVSKLMAVDLDLDGDLDLAASSALSPDQIFVWRHLADRSFEELRPLDMGTRLIALTAADLTGDGRPQLLASMTDEIWVVENLSAPRSADLNQDGVPDECDGAPHVAFRRGDVNGDSRRNLSDAVSIVAHLFQGAGPLGCEKAADTDDDGRINLTDGILLVRELYAGAPDVPLPPLECGLDPSPDALRCEAFSPCTR
jgi:hypothetical protein